MLGLSGLLPIKQMTELHYRLTNEEWRKIKKDLTYSQMGVLLYVRTLDPSGYGGVTPRITDMASELGMSKGSVSKALRILDQKQYINDGQGRWKFNLIQSDRPEARVRDRLHAELGGLKEVSTLAGLIDLLTDTEVIEVKRLPDWKGALGQVMAYSGFYPSHQKRIHLFSDKPIEADSVPHILEICSTLGVVVSFEEIEVEVTVNV